MQIQATVKLEQNQVKDIIASYLSTQLGRQIDVKDVTVNISPPSSDPREGYSPGSASYSVTLRNLNSDTFRISRDPGIYAPGTR